MKMKQCWIEKFGDSSGQMIFEGGYTFSKKGKHCLIGKNGNMILLNETLFEQILNRNPNEELWFKLIQRKLASHRQHIAKHENETDLIKPTYFMIDLTSRCNMGCRYCLRESGDSINGKNIDREMLLKICRYIVEYSRENNIEPIFIQPWGGEPLLEIDKVFLIWQEMRNSGVETYINIETNGLLLSEELIKRFYTHGIGYGISIDGFAQIHDKQRTLINGDGTHKRVEWAIKKTQEYYGEDTSILATITKQSALYIEDIIDYFAHDLRLKKIKINFVHKSIFQKDEGFCVNESDIRECIDRMFNKIVTLNENNLEIMEYNLWIKMMNILTNRKMDACISRGCSGGRNMIAFDSHGNIFPCDVTDFPEESMGNIKDTKKLLDAIEEAMQNKPYFMSKETGECRQCPWKHFCNGGCTVHVKCEGKAPGSVDMIECSINKILYPKIIELIFEKPKLVNRMLGYDIL